MAPKISRLACFLIVARPLAKLEEDIPELMVHNILRSTTNLYNQVAATIFSPRSTDDGHNDRFLEEMVLSILHSRKLRDHRSRHIVCCANSGHP